MRESKLTYLLVCSCSTGPTRYKVIIIHQRSVLVHEMLNMSTAGVDALLAERRRCHCSIERVHHSTFAAVDWIQTQWISTVLCQNGLSDIFAIFYFSLSRIMYDTTAYSTSPVKFLEINCAWKWCFFDV